MALVSEPKMKAIAQSDRNPCPGLPRADGSGSDDLPFLNDRGG